MTKQRTQRVQSRAKKGAPLAWLLAHKDHQGDGCLTWPFGVKSNGYGQLFYHGKNVGAHRLMCEIAHGAPAGNVNSAAHICGKGHLACVNPRHLQWKTPRENHADKILHGTHLSGEMMGGSTLTNGEVIAIIALRGKLPLAQVAELFGTTTGQVSRIQMRMGWKSVGNTLVVGQGMTDNVLRPT
jgi:hypothetical protein